MGTTRCPVCAAEIPSAQFADHVATIHPTVVDTEMAEARASARHACPYCGQQLATPEMLKQHIARHGH